jgi:hypothetical protein
MITQVVVAFVPSPSTNNNNNNKASSSSISSKLNFGFNGLGTPNDEKKKNKTKDSSKATTTTQNGEKKITTKGLFQLIAAGMGAPFLGDYEGVDNVSYNINTIVTRRMYTSIFFRLLSLTYIPLNIYYSLLNCMMHQNTFFFTT